MKKNSAVIKKVQKIMKMTNIHLIYAVTSIRSSTFTKQIAIGAAK